MAFRRVVAWPRCSPEAQTFRLIWLSEPSLALQSVLRGPTVDHVGAGVYGWGFSCVDIHDLPTDTPALELEKQGLATRVWRG